MGGYLAQEVCYKVSTRMTYGYSCISISGKFKSAPSIFQGFRLNTLHQVKLAFGKTISTDLKFAEIEMQLYP